MLESRFGTYRQWKSWQRENFFTTSETDRVYFEAELRKSGIAAQGGMTVLELGFGNGNFARFCQDRGFDYVGTELDVELVQRARDAGLKAYTSDRSLGEIVGGRRIDLVVALDVFEHVLQDDLVTLLREVRRVLAGTGRLVARFPSGDSPFSGPLFNGDGTHVNLMGIGKLGQLCQLSGMRIERAHPQTIPLTGLGPMHSLRKAPIVIARKLVARVVSGLYFGGKPYVIDPNMVAVLAPDPA
jgi:SAM-dependent methyltransferase